MSNKQTAVEWLYNQISFNGLDDPDGQVFEQAKAMDKEQKKDAYKSNTYGLGDDECAEQYYNETYNVKDN